MYKPVTWLRVHLHKKPNCKNMDSNFVSKSQKTPAHCLKQYDALKKAELRSEQVHMNSDTPASSAKSLAQHSEEYSECQKQRKLGGQLQTTDNINLFSKTATQCVKEYCARLKAKQKSEKMHVNLAKTPTQLVEEYCARQKAKRSSEKTHACLAKTPAQRAKEYRARKKAKLISEGAYKKKTAKSPAQRAKECRERKKAKRLQQEALNHSDSGNSVKDVICTLAYKTSDKKKVKGNLFGNICDVCGRLWFLYGLRPAPLNSYELLRRTFPTKNVESFLCCNCCIISLKVEKLPTMPVSN